MFDWTINLGHILTILALIGAVVVPAITIKNRVDAISVRIHSLDEEMKKLVDILVQQGRQEERMDGMDGRMLAQGMRIDDLIRKVDRFFVPSSDQQHRS